MNGRRRADTRLGRLPGNVRRGDYWKVLQSNGEPVISPSPSNLTHTMWMVAAPIGDGAAFAIGNLVNHTVREEEDGTISVRPGDGSSNSILISRPGTGDSFHGYIEHGVWRDA